MRSLPALLPLAALALLGPLPAHATAQSSARGPAAPRTEPPVELRLPAEPPELVTLELPLGPAAREPLARIELARHALRAPGAFVRVVGPLGASADQAPPPVTTYRGTVLDDPGSAVVASLLPEGWTAWIELGSGATLELRPDGRRGLHRLRPGTAPDGPVCGAPDEAAPADAAATLPFSLQPAGARCLARAEIAFDADFEYFQAKGASVPGVVAAIDAILNQVDFFYQRDVQITFALTAYVVRTAPFYAPTGGGDLLDRFRTEWSTNQSGIQRDMAHLMTGKPGSLIEFGGLAYVGVVCNPASHYGWSMDGANIVGHELGHNFGAGHCHDLEPCNNMCGACFYVGPNTRRIVSAFRDSRTCLEHVGDRPAGLPPYAMLDRAVRRKDRLETGVTLDVLANDDDGDCQPVWLTAFDARSERDGSVRRAADATGRWRDPLEYRPPPQPFVGLDRFTYRVGDGRLESPGEVRIESLPLELLGYWPLDDGAGTLASDHSRGGRDGVLAGGPLWQTGRVGGALYFDGADDRVTLPALAADSNHLTLACWVRRQGPQESFAGLVFSRAGSTVAGLNLSPGGALRYHWDDDPATWGFGSGLVLPDDQWTFVALVVEPERATLYARLGGVLSAKVNVHPHAPEAFDGGTLLGRDPSGQRRFRGWLDDVRVYPYALDASELARLAEASGPADAPFPRDGGKITDVVPTLAWVPGLDALTHDLYFGTSYAAVRAATPASPEFLGSPAGTSAPLPPVVAGTSYFWRVDEHGPAGLVSGPVWQFEPAAFHRWPLDESAGTHAADVAGGLAGTYLNGVGLARPGATPALGLSAEFDGLDDRVSLPALGLDAQRVTLSCWLKRNGLQNDWAGIVFSRAGSTVAGLHFGTGQELRYTWNDDGATWGWDSGLVVPDGQWVFAALVVEPSHATLYLGQGGVLSQATNAVNHASEAFDGTLWLGRDPHSSPRHYRGGLDDVRVYDHALAPAEIQALYLGSL